MLRSSDFKIVVEIQIVKANLINVYCFKWQKYAYLKSEVEYLKISPVNELCALCTDVRSTTYSTHHEVTQLSPIDRSLTFAGFPFTLA